MIDAKWLRYIHVLHYQGFPFHLTNGYRMFNQQELQVLLGGVNTPIDITDLRQNTVYGGLYDNQEPTIVAFWRVGSRT